MLIDGRKIASDIQNELKIKIMNAAGKRPPTLAVIQVGDHPASTVYIKRKIKACEEVGITSIRIHLAENISQGELLAHLQSLNQRSDVDGILVQMPLPGHLHPMDVIESIDPNKDIDGFHPLNVGKLLIGDQSGFVPCTPLGIQMMLLRQQITIAGKHVVIVGRSTIVGKPLAALLVQNRLEANATVTIAHSKTKNISEITKTADILIAAIGSPLFITQDMVKPGVVVIDVGINKNPETGKIVGDVDYENIFPIASAITPVPGGVGPMTIAMLLSNTFHSFQRQFL